MMTELAVWVFRLAMWWWEWRQRRVRREPSRAALGRPAR